MSSRNIPHARISCRTTPDVARNRCQNEHHDDTLDTKVSIIDHLTSPQDLIALLADLQINMKNRPQAQLLTLRPINSTTMTIDRKTENF